MALIAYFLMRGGDSECFNYLYITIPNKCV